MSEQGWHPIETAPMDGTWVLTISRNGAGQWTIPTTMRWDRGDWRLPVMDDSNLMVYHRPTHWMPLPSAPEPPR